MAAAGAEAEKELLSSVVGDIRCYSGSDPLRPWLRYSTSLLFRLFPVSLHRFPPRSIDRLIRPLFASGMRKMERALPPATLHEKLPRFLQKCAQEFQDDTRYRDDPRYLRVWIQLMDYVADAKPLLKKMETNGIGLKRASFYMAYALYYEKHKRFSDAEKKYRLGIQNLAEPIGELHKAHEQFILRMESYKRRKDKLQERIPRKVESSATAMNQVKGSALVGKSETEDACHHGLVEPTINTKEALDAINSMFLEPLEPETMLKRRSKREKTNYNQQRGAFDIFVDEDEHNSNDPDPNMLQNNSMKQGHTKSSEQTRGFEIFVDEDGPNGNNQNVGQNRNSKKANNQETGGLEIFVDEDGPNSSDHNLGQNRHSRKQNMKSNQETSGFEIFVDENEANVAAYNATCHKNNRRPPRPLCDSSKHQEETDFQKPFVAGFAILPDEEEEQYWKTVDNTNSRTVQPTHNNTNSLHPVQANSGTRYHEGSHPVSSGLQEDTVIRRFVGSTIDDEPKVENACHHGLVDPTVNLKEAMDDINNMFGKPLNFKGEKTKRKTNALSNGKAAPVSGFSILADDDIKENTCKASRSNSCKFGDENGLFEPTITTRDVMAEINDMFGMPLDF
nr:unnamed protein product [Digitaria exilis]